MFYGQTGSLVVKLNSVKSNKQRWPPERCEVKMLNSFDESKAEQTEMKERPDLWPGAERWIWRWLLRSRRLLPCPYGRYRGSACDWFRPPWSQHPKGKRGHELKTFQWWMKHWDDKLVSQGQQLTVKVPQSELYCSEVWAADHGRRCRRLNTWSFLLSDFWVKALKYNNFF